MNLNRRGFEFSFGWIFSIIIGGFIIFLAVYAATRLVGIERNVGDTMTSKEVGVLTNILETSVEESKLSKINFREEVRIYNTCNHLGNFGLQRISISTKSGIGEEWAKPGVPTEYYDKYLFSDKVLEGKSFNVLGKSFNFPFKASNYIIVWSGDKNYCFVNPPSFIEEDIKKNSLGNINVSSSLANCNRKDISVCFSVAGCDIDVNMQSRTVKKSKTVYFIDDLIYPAIFSDPDIYECQLKRMSKRTGELSLIYLEKIKLNSETSGCGSNLVNLFENLAQVSNITSSAELRSFEILAKELENKNEQISYCKIF